jgi:hypothetical protein
MGELVVGGSLIVGGGAHLRAALSKDQEIKDKAAREVEEEQRIPRPDPESVKIAQNISNGESAPFSRDIDVLITKLNQAKQAEAQNQEFKPALQKKLIEKSDELPSGWRYLGDSSIVAIGAIGALGGLVNIQKDLFSLLSLWLSRRLNVPAHNGQPPQQPESPQAEDTYSPPPTYNTSRWSRLDVETKLLDFDTNQTRQIQLKEKPQSKTPQDQDAEQQQGKAQHKAVYHPSVARARLLRLD